MSTAFARALDQLGGAIARGDLPAGHADTVDGFVTRTGASRSVVREVTRVLTALGMLSAGRRVGLRVLGQEHWELLDPHVIRWRLDGPDRAVQVEELRALRRAVEPEAAAAAARAVGRDGAAPAAGAVGRRDEEQVAALAAAQAMAAAAGADDPGGFLAADRALHAAVLALSGNGMFVRLGGVIEEALRSRALHERADLPPDPHDLALHREVARAIIAGEETPARVAMAEIVDRTEPPAGTDQTTRV
ncbi:FCD domain-containing protein [Brachybacterium sp. NBEC-018]|uniref:FadR/GntR family transcriptional regulator n=1 Tax=Brachybacterium sp. NBEC-018 TaxID=2996004 RepID=UPI002174F44F|nr:FCD domain-containing protein [Brachybacterium sp. NBEC-018]UVY85082.1 FCD domain-containing protein [Brachybacterium sp. NBEC-018]